MSERIRAALAVLALVLAACAEPAPGWAANRCADGGQPRPDEGGIGGTGARPGGADDDDSGIGGTGISGAGDTGIIGTITGFASICVGGREIHYDAASRVAIDGRPSTSADLAVGQVVEVVAHAADGELYADDIAVRHVVAGPVTGAAPERNEIEVMGQTVRLSPTTRFGVADEEQAASASDFALGSVVAVSGSRQPDGAIAASRVSRTDGALARVAGPVASVEPGQMSVGGTPVSIERGAEPSVGGDVRVAGRWEGGRLIASSVEAIPPLPFDGRVERVDVEGYAIQATADALRVGPYVFSLPPEAAAHALSQIEANPRVRIEAVVRGRQAIIEHLAPAPTLPVRPERNSDAARQGRDVNRSETGDQSQAEGAGEPPARDSHGALPPRGPEQSGFGPPPLDRPDRPDRPAAFGAPERPERIERPPLGGRDSIPDRPPRPDRVQLPPRP
jgi:hypothetical protein